MSHNLYIPEMFGHVSPLSITFRQTFAKIQMQLVQSKLSSTSTTSYYLFQTTAMCDIRDYSEFRGFHDDDYKNSSVVGCGAV